MPNSNLRDPFTYPYLSALSTPNEDFYIVDTPLRSYARQPTPSEDTAAHGNIQIRQISGLEEVNPSVEMLGNLATHSPYTMDNREISPIGGEILFIQPEESVLPAAAATEQVLRDFIKIPQSRPLDLSSLKDIANPAKLPNLTHLAALAIWASPSKRLTLSEIYEAIEGRYPILRDHREKKWKDSLRHRLSLKAVFIRVGQTEKGKRGGHWALDVSKGLNENKRPRKQGSRGAPTAGTSPASAHNSSLSDYEDQGSSDYSDFSRHSSASLSPPVPHELSVSPMLNYLSYQLSETDISAHHVSSTSGSPDIAQVPYGSENMMLHGVEPLGYSSAQPPTSYYAPNVSEHLFSNDDADTELHNLALNRDSSSSNMGSYQSHHNSPDYDSRLDF